MSLQPERLLMGPVLGMRYDWYRSDFIILVPGFSRTMQITSLRYGLPELVRRNENGLLIFVCDFEC